MATVSPATDSKSARLGAWFVVVALCWTILIAVLAWWAHAEEHPLALKIALSSADDGIDPAATPPSPNLARISDRNAASSFKRKTLAPQIENTYYDKSPMITVRYGGIWTIGIIGLCLFWNRLQSHLTELKRSKEALQDSGALQRALMANLSAGIVIIDPVTRIIESVNPYTAALFGTPEDRIVGRRCHSFLCPAEENACPVCDLGQKVDNAEKVMVCADGSRIPILKSVVRFQFDGREKLLETFVDISESKKAESLLNQMRLNYETFFNRIEDFLLVLDEEGNILHTNSTVIDRLGYSEAELVGKSVLIVHSPELRKEAGRILVDILAGVTNRCTIPLMAKSGEQITVETRITSGFWNGKAALYGVCKDLTQVKRSEQMFSRAFHLSSVMMCLTRLDDGTFIDANETLIKATGYSRAELIDGKRSALSLYAHADQRKEILEKIKSEGSINEFEIAYRLKDGSIKDCIISANSLHVGNEPCLVSVIVDITHRKEVQRRQNLMAEVLEILNGPSSMTDAIGRALNAIQAAMGFEAVGIRLRNGDDFPYLTQNGFSKSFLLTENTLVDRGQGNSSCDKSSCADINGNFDLECICGLVISGQTDPAIPWFTAGGSFWTNDSSQLFNRPDDINRALHLRNRCILEGYRSMAIVPIRANHKIVGVLQLNDRKKDRLTPETVQFFEGLGTSIGMAMVRKEAEDSLRESEDKFRKYVENSFDVIFTVDADGIFLFTSSAWEMHLGYPAGDIMGKRFETFVHPDDVPLCIGYLQHVWNAEPSRTSLPYRVKRADGGWCWFEANCTRFVDAKGMVQIIGVGRNITEQKRLNDELWESEEKFRNYIENTFDIIFTLDKDGVFLFLSPVFAQHFGYPVGDVIGKAFPAIVHPDDVPNCVAIFERIANTGQSEMTIPYRVRHANGGWLWVEANITRIYDEKGNLEILGVARDITDRKQTEQALQASQAKYKTLFDSSLDAIVLFADGPRWMSGNPAAFALFGCRDEAEFLEYDPVSLSPEFQPDNSPSAEQFARMMEITTRRGSHYFEWNFRRADGSEFLGAVSLNKTDFEGQAAIQACIRDITAQKRAALALEREAIRYRTIMDASMDGLYIMDTEGYLIDSNDAFLRNLGYTREEAQHLHVCDWNAQWSREQIVEMMRLQMEQGASFETIHRRKDGSIFDVEVNGSSMILDGKVLLCNSVRNITERKRVEAEMNLKNVLLLTQQEVSLDGILAVDRDNNMLVCNRRFREMWKIPPQLSDSKTDIPLLQSVNSQVADPEAFLGESAITCTNISTRRAGTKSFWPTAGYSTGIPLRSSEPTTIITGESGISATLRSASSRKNPCGGPKRS